MLAGGGRSIPVTPFLLANVVVLDIDSRAADACRVVDVIGCRTRTLVVSLSPYYFVDDGCVADNESTARQVFVCLSAAPPGAAFVSRLDKA